MQSMWEGYPKRIGNISISVNDMGQTIECDAAIEGRSLGCPIAWKFSIWNEKEKKGVILCKHHKNVLFEEGKLLIHDKSVFTLK